MLVEFIDQPEFGIWNLTAWRADRYVWLEPTIHSHRGLATLAGDGMIGIRYSAIRPATINPDQLEIPL